jgi:hypothetical protein
MDSTITGLGPVIGIIVVVLIGAFVWEIGRRLGYWTAAKIFGWSKEEKFRRETAWLDRAVSREERRANKDAEAARNADRRRWGATIVTIAIAFLAFSLASELHLSWWVAAVTAVSVYIGATMAAGVTFKW